jgi:hypothetical protein
MAKWLHTSNSNAASDSRHIKIDAVRACWRQRAAMA